MDLEQYRPLAEAVTAIGVAAGTVWAGWKFVWPLLVKAVKTTVCFFGRVRAVFQSLENQSQMSFSMSDLQGQVKMLSGVAIRVQEAVSEGGTIPKQLKAMVAQSDERGAQLLAQGAQIGSVVKKVDVLSSTIKATQNINPRVGTFETDSAGRCDYVNRTYLRWTGLQLQDAMGWGWINAIHPDDVARVRSSWQSAVNDSRRFQDRYRMVNVIDGTVFEVDGTAEPIPEGVIPAERWIGSIYKTANPTSSVAT